MRSFTMIHTSQIRGREKIQQGYIHDLYKRGKYNISRNNPKLYAGLPANATPMLLPKPGKIISVNALAKLHTQRWLSNLESKTGNKNRYGKHRNVKHCKLEFINIIILL